MSNSPIKQTKKTTTKKTTKSKQVKKTTRPRLDPQGRGISTGLQAVDLALGGIGWLRGFLNALTGPDQQILVGMLLKTVAAAQARGERCAWIQVGGAIDPDDAVKAGVDLAELTVYKVEDGSPYDVVQALGKAVRRSPRLDVLVVDSMPSPAAAGWKRATKAVDAIVASLKGTKTACVYAMCISERDSGDRLRGKDLGARYTRCLSRGTQVRVQVSARRSSLGRFKTVTVGRSGSMKALLSVDARGRIRLERLSPEGLVCFGFRTAVLTEPAEGFVAFGKRQLGMDDGSATFLLQKDSRLARRLQKAIVAAAERDPKLLSGLEG